MCIIITIIIIMIIIMISVDSMITIVFQGFTLA